MSAPELLKHIDKDLCDIILFDTAERGEAPHSRQEWEQKKWLHAACLLAAAASLRMFANADRKAF